MPSSILSIAIPTFNRSGILLENLEAMLPELQKFGIPVYISDDGQGPEVGVALAPFREKHPHVNLRQNCPSLGHDRNCLSTLAWPESEYVWYLGDSMRIEKGGIAAVLGCLSERPSFVFVNCNATSIAEASMKIEDLRGFLRKAAWYLTLSGATVYSRQAIRWCIANLGGREFHNFQQLGAILAYASLNDVGAFWLNDRLLTVNKKKKSYWTRDVVQVFGHDWIDLVEAFPVIFDDDSIETALKSHSKNQKLFSTLNLVNFRAAGAITLPIMKANRTYLKRTSSRGLTLFWLVLLFPRKLAILLKKAVKAAFGLISTKSRWN